MKYKISYIKKQKNYNFTIRFKNLEHKLKKLAQYKEGSTNFKATKILDTVKENVLVAIKNKPNYYRDAKGYKYYIKDGIRIKSKQPVYDRI